jgi:hypothetical protein
MRTAICATLRMMVVVLLLTACGGGGGDDGPSAVDLGVPVVDTSTVANGSITITFPEAPAGAVISAVVAQDGAQIVYADVSPAPAAGDGVEVFFPMEGSYNVLITAGGSQQNPIVIEVSSGADFSLSGDVRDGASGSEAGVKAGIELHWRPVVGAPDLTVAIAESDAAADGAYTFDHLLGPVDNFSVVVKGGTLP